MTPNAAELAGQDMTLRLCSYGMLAVYCYLLFRVMVCDAAKTFEILDPRKGRKP
jgi:hypothetical protein